MIGVDVVSQRRYIGDEFYQMDVFEFLRSHPRSRDAVCFAASPPCQGYIKAGIVDRAKHFRLIEPTRELLIASGKPYVIENVMDAPLNDPVILSGPMFDLMVLRERKFETNWPLPQPPILPFTGKVVQMGRQPKPGEYISVVGHFTDVKYARKAMGIEWMTRDELAQAIPPAYTKYIGDHLIKYLTPKPVSTLHKLFAQVARF